MIDVTIPEQLRGKIGASYRQIDYWVRCGYLEPHPTGPGSGYPREWPPEEIEVAKAMSALVDVGFKPDLAAKAARELVHGGLGWPGPRRVVLSVFPRLVLEVG